MALQRWHHLHRIALQPEMPGRSGVYSSQLLGGSDSGMMRRYERKHHRLQQIFNIGREGGIGVDPAFE